jgi:hypothetical protein
MRFADLMDVEGGRSVWTIDWIGSPRYRTSHFDVTVYAARRSPQEKNAGFQQACITLPFDQLAQLASGPAQELYPPLPLYSGGAHYELDIACSSAVVRAIYAGRDGLNPRAIAWPGSLAPEALQCLDGDRVIAISDVYGADPEFCVIPCMEVARFFFCRSRLLARHLLTGWDKLLCRDLCARPHAGPIVGLRAGFRTTMDDALWLCQYAHSWPWREAVDSVARSIRLMNLSTPPAPFRCSFPLSGDLKLAVEALAVRSDTPIGRRFFVTRIVDAPLPVNAATYWVHFQPAADASQPSEPIHTPFVEPPWRDHVTLRHSAPRMLAGSPSTWV